VDLTKLTLNSIQPVESNGMTKLTLNAIPLPDSDNQLRKLAAEVATELLLGGRSAIGETKFSLIKWMTLPRILVTKGGSEFEAYPLPSSK
jgi:hypothetical protein